MMITEKDNLCLKCPEEIRGLCCYFSHTFSNGMSLILTNHPCKYLNIEERICKIYERRHEINLNCLTKKEMITCGTIPRECPYVKENTQYQKRKDIRIVKIPFPLPNEIQEEYEEWNNLPHGEIAIYSIKRSFICPKCESSDIQEFFIEDDIISPKGLKDETYCLRFFCYQCQSCKHKWKNKKKKVLKE